MFKWCVILFYITLLCLLGAFEALYIFMGALNSLSEECSVIFVKEQDVWLGHRVNKYLFVPVDFIGFFL